MSMADIIVDHLQNNNTVTLPLFNDTAVSFNCSSREQLDGCGGHCQQTCLNYNMPHMCPMICGPSPACVCANPYVRDTENESCILPENCPPQPPPPPTPTITTVSSNQTTVAEQNGNTTSLKHICTKAHEVYKACGTACQPVCGHVINYMCVNRCVAGCFCRDGFVCSYMTHVAQSQGVGRSLLLGSR
jgi:hypothetical protein